MLLTETIAGDLRTRLLDFVRSRVRNRDDAEDLVQDILLRAHVASSGLQRSERLVPWLYGIARNAVVDYYRRASVRNSREEQRLDLDEMADEWPEVPSRDAYAALSQCILPFIQALPEAYREAVTETALGGRSQVDYANTHGLSVSGAKSRVQRARRMLADDIKSCCRLAFDTRGGLFDTECRDSKPCTGSCT